jgi:hypothetical protein
MAHALAGHRRELLLIDRDAEGLARVSAGLRCGHTMVADLADERQWESLLASPEWTRAPIAELYACAGFGQRGAFASSQIGSELDMLRVNVMARLRLAHAAIADMTPRQFGRIVFIASSSAFQALPYMSTYAASNAALLLASEGIGYETAADGIHVMTVCPGGMQTNFQRSAGVRTNDRERLMAPEDVAAAILSGLARQRHTLIVSTRALAMSLLARGLPRRASVLLWGRLMQSLR